MILHKLIDDWKIVEDLKHDYICGLLAPQSSGEPSWNGNKVCREVADPQLSRMYCLHRYECRELKQQLLWCVHSFFAGKKICPKQSPMLQNLNFHPSPWETCARPQLSHGRMLMVGSNAAWISSFAATMPGACHLGCRRKLRNWNFSLQRRIFDLQIWF